MFLLWFYCIKTQKKISQIRALKSRADESEKGGIFSRPYVTSE